MYEIEESLDGVLLDPPRHVPASEVTTWLSDAFAGNLPKPELDGRSGLFLGKTTVHEAGNVTYFPSFGAILSEAGKVYRETAEEARFIAPDYSFLPRTAPTVHLPEGGVFMAWGGLHNYGHFVLDCLPGVVALQNAGSTFPLLSPPVKDWQRQFYELLGIEPLIVEDPVVHLDRAAWSNCMDHYLHKPNQTLLTTRDRILASVAPTTKGPERIYLSRRNANEKRRMTNEDEVETVLSREGFAIIHPQEMSVREQISLMRGASVVVSATGAQMTNCIFMNPGATVVEILPAASLTIWVRAFCYLCKLEYRFHVFPASVSPHNRRIMTFTVDPYSVLRLALR